MTTIFISHRRKDKGYAARGINDALCRKFGKRNVYFDLDSILVGLDWRKQIDEMLAECDVMLVVIGDDWLEINESGRSRLENEDDLVHFEVSSALKRDIPVIPVLVGSASIPAKETLPDVLKPLHYRQAVEVRDDANFNAQIEKLIIGIEQVAPEPAAPWGRSSLLTWTLRIAPVIVIVGVGVIAWQPLVQWISPIKGQSSLIEEATEGQTPEPESGTKYVESEKYVESGTTYVETPNIQSQELPDKQSTASKSEQEKESEFVAGQVFKDCYYCPEMVVIPAGIFLMGESNPQEQPQHRVTVPRFAMGKHEVTFDEYDAFASSTGKNLPEDEGWGRGKRPVINVSWRDAQAYVRWLRERTLKRYRLPSEAEWEYAARAGTSTNYSHWWGDFTTEDGKVWANCDGCGSEWDDGKTAPVGQFPANPFELHDTAGNVLEWVEDCWQWDNDSGPDDGSARRAANGGDCTQRVIRGGSWDASPAYLRSAYRSKIKPNFTYFTIGFRLAQSLPD